MKLPKVELLTEVEKELGNHINGKETIGRNVPVGKAHDNEQNSEDRETHELDSLSAKNINRRHRHPVPWHRTSKHDDDVTDGGVVHELIHVVRILG